MKGFLCPACSNEELLQGFYNLCNSCSKNMEQIHTFLDNELLQTSSEKVIQFLSL